jgi:trehalose 6-phosphate synthase
VQDYQLQRVPALLRELRPDLRIGFFLHVPFPPPELFAQLPWREPILRGLLGADLVGFHTAAYAENFRRAAGGLPGVTAQTGRLALADGRRVRLGVHPISIDTRQLEELARRPRIRQAAARLPMSWP